MVALVQSIGALTALVGATALFSAVADIPATIARRIGKCIPS